MTPFFRVYFILRKRVGSLIRFVQTLWRVPFPSRTTSMRDMRCRIIEIDDVDECVDVLQTLSENTRDTDDLCDTLTRCFRMMLPRDDELQRISLLQQRVVGSGGVAEYAVTTLWLCALQSIIETELDALNRKRRMVSLPRSRSEHVLQRRPLIARSPSV